MKFREIDLFDFMSFFGLDFFKYAGPLRENRPVWKGEYDFFPIRLYGLQRPQYYEANDLEKSQTGGSTLTVNINRK